MTKEQVTILDAIEVAAIEIGQIYCLYNTKEIEEIIRRHIGKSAPSGTMRESRDKECADFLLPIHRWVTH